MKKKIIYVDFIFYHKRVSYFKYNVLNILSFIINKFNKTNTNKNNSLSYNKNRKMFK